MYAIRSYYEMKIMKRNKNQREKEKQVGVREGNRRKQRAQLGHAFEVLDLALYQLCVFELF